MCETSGEMVAREYDQGGDDVDPDMLDLGLAPNSDSGSADVFGSSHHGSFSPYRAPQRRSNMRNVSGTSSSDGTGGAGGASRQSLAFELAAAMDTDQSSTSDLLNELGITEEVDEEGQEDEYAEQEDEWDELGGNDRSNAQESPRSRHLDLPHHEDPLSTPMHRQRSSRSSALSSSAQGGSPAGPSTAHTSPPSGLAADEHASEVEAEWDFAEDARVLSEATASTDAFLTLLRQTNDPSVVHSSPRSSLRPSGLGNDGKAGETGETTVERLIGQVVKAMAEQTRDREAQVRELKEMEKALAKTNPRILADLEALPSPSPSPSPLTSMATLEHTTNGTEEDPDTPRAEVFGTSSAGSVFDDEDDLDPAFAPATPTSPTLHRMSLPDRASDPVPSLDALSSLSHLRSLTSSLILSLSSLNDHSQIARASNAEAARRLKNVRTMARDWKGEVEEVEASRRRIGEWEREYGTYERGRFASEVNEVSPTSCSTDALQC